MARIMSMGVFEVSNNLCEGSNNPCEPSNSFYAASRKAAPAAEEMRSIVHEAAEPRVAGESVGAAIARAARQLGLGYSRARAHWYGLARSISLEEGDALRQARIKLARQRAARLRAELAELDKMERANGVEMGVAHGLGPADMGRRETDRCRRVVPGSREAAA